jgi:hypothetical protein
MADELHAEKQIIQRSNDVIPVRRQFVPDIAETHGRDGRHAWHKQNVVDA